MSQTKNKLILAAITLAVALGLGTWAAASFRSNQDSGSKPQTTNTAQQAHAGRTEIAYLAEPGVTSLEQLKSEASDVVILDSEYGALVDSIEGHKGGADGKYWSFYVNGEMSQVGAGSYVQKEGDFIEWKFQKL